MKTLRMSLAVIALLFTGVAANAIEKVNAGKAATKDDVLNTYISAISTGDTKSLDKVLNNDMQFNVKRGDNVTAIRKDDLLNQMKNTTAVAPVNTTTTVLQSDDDSEKVKIVFNYDGYTRTDIVTLDRTLGWAITNVISSNS